MVKFAQLDAEDLRKADTYIPIARKMLIIKRLLPGCIEEVQLSLERGKNVAQAMPPKWQESVLGKRLIMSYVLAGFYLHKIDVSYLMGESPTFDFSARQYDVFSQLFAQLDAFKRGPGQEAEIRSIAAAILSDYKDFEKLLGAEIYNLLQSKNDLCSRVVSMLTMQADPEFVQKSVEALNEAKKAAEDAAKEHQEVMERFQEKGA